MVDTDSTASPQALYRFYGDDGALLYVGITNNPSGRFKQHGQTKTWWPDVRGISVEWYDNRAAVFAAETRAIHVENPLHNIQRPPLPNNTITTDGEYDDESDQLEWDCAWCLCEVEDGDGYMYVNAEELFEVRHNSRVRDAEEEAGEGFQWGDPYPQPALWRAAHHACVPGGADEEAYGIDIRKLRTYPQLLWWTAHLSSKTWMPETNWMAMLRRLAEAAGGAA